MAYAVPDRVTALMGARGLIALLVSLAVLVAACGGGDSGGSADTSSGGSISRNADNAKTRLVIGSKNFTEQQVLGQIYAQGLHAAGYTVDTKLNLGDENIAHDALKQG